MRKAASRVAGTGMTLPSVAPGLWGGVGSTRAAELSYALFMQLEADGADETLCLQVWGRRLEEPCCSDRENV